MVVDFVDEEEEENEEGDGSYGDLDANVKEDADLKRLLWGRVDGWVDWAVGWMDFRTDEEVINDSILEEDIVMGDQDKGAEQRLGARRPLHARTESIENTVAVPPAPENPNSVLSDARWLFNVAKSVLV
jgi:hypothetical protein